jgi:DNA polymerase III delta prime subunit
MAKLLVIRSAKDYSPDKGYAIPIAIEEDDGSIRNIEVNEFPNNNRIFISKEYEKIDEQFKDRELFILTDYRSSESEEWKENNNLEKYYSRVIWATRTETNTYLPIIKMSMPDISTGQVENGFDIPASNSPFFILNNNTVSGPFLAAKEDEYWLLTPATGVSPLNLPTHHIAQFELSELKKAEIIIDNEALGRDKLILTSLRKAAEVKFNTKDYISNSGIIKFYGKNGFGKGIPSITKNEAQKLSQIIDVHCKKRKAFNNDDRFKRLTNIIGEFINSQDYRRDIIDDFLKTKDGKEYLDNYVTKHRDSILRDKSKELSSQAQAHKEWCEKEVSEASAKVEEKKSELSKLILSIEQARKNSEKEIQKIKKQTEEETERVLHQKREDLSIENSRLEDENKKLREDNDALLEKHSYLNNILDLKNQEYHLKETINNQISELEGLKLLVKKQKALISSPDIAETLIEHKTLIHMLNGISSDSNGSDITPLVLNKSSITLSKEYRKEFIQNLCANFDKEPGRSFSYDEMANLAICTMQSFLTILSGSPGTGKTSTALRLANAMHLTDKAVESAGGFLSISVGRGWVASRDLLGFYNSLKNVYQPSRTGFYQFLRSIEKSSTDKFLNLVLLDEANLSNIEHYWSDFLGMCDLYDKGNRLDLGIINDKENCYLAIPATLRFIATINNDATTERLSPRLIDRAPIITLNHTYDDANFEGAASEIFDGAVLYQQLQEAFCVTDEIDLDLQDLINLDQITELLASNSIKAAPIHVSNRKINAIKKYCCIAQELEYKHIPLDYAVSQHILPLINGYGTGFKNRLTKFEEKLDELNFTISRKILQSIIQKGDEFSDFYSFF